ncbi:MAG: heme exporter protein CcmD [Rhodospirillales bacterium]
MSEFFAMGGYAAFVWPCYAAFAVVIAALALHAALGLARARAALAHLESGGETEASGAGTSA